MTSPQIETAQKASVVDSKVISRTVQDLPEKGEQPTAGGLGFVFMTAHLGDEIEPWGRAVKLRDRQLRETINIEPLFMSALGTVCSRNATFSWKLEGPDEKETDRLQEVLQNAEFGAGWAEFVLKISMDLYTQDQGAFFEIIRESDSPTAKVVGIAHLDAARCYPTGNPEEPVWYVDRHNKYHTLKWYQVVHILEVPTAHETLPGLQYCAYTRLLMQAQIMRDTEIYTKEKVGGRNPRAISLIQGVKAEEVRLAVLNAQLLNDSMGRQRYTNPIMVSSADPNASVDFKTLEVASLPDGFDADLNQKQYLTILALAFMTDYQEFAPLPGGGLGTGSQSEVLDKKSRGKGPGLFMKLILQALNFRVLPKEIQFSWDEQDIQEDKIVAEVKEIRANYRKTMLESGQITPEVAWMMMLEDGDLTQEQYDLLLRQQEEARLAEGEAAVEAEAMASEMQNEPAIEEETGGPTPFQPSKPNTFPEEKAWNEATQLRDPKGRFAGTVGAGGSGGGATASADPNVLAQNVLKKAVLVEPEITASIQNVVAREGGEMAGLNFRLKSEGSMARKIREDAVYEKIPRAKAAAKISDAVRYTALFSEDKYDVGSNAVMKSLRNEGYEVQKVKNFWVHGDGTYYGVNLQLVHKSGQRAELQFHTPASFHIKERVNHPLYEEWRLSSTPLSRKQQLQAEMKQNWATVPKPPRAHLVKLD